MYVCIKEERDLGPENCTRLQYSSSITLSSYQLFILAGVLEKYYSLERELIYELHFYRHYTDKFFKEDFGLHFCFILFLY